MNRNLIIALVLLMLTVLILLFNRGSTDVNLLVATWSFSKALVFLSFTSVGVVIGLLLK